MYHNQYWIYLRNWYKSLKEIVLKNGNKCTLPRFSQIKILFSKYLFYNADFENVKIFLWKPLLEKL